MAWCVVINTIDGPEEEILLTLSGCGIHMVGVGVSQIAPTLSQLIYLVKGEQSQFDEAEILIGKIKGVHSCNFIAHRTLGDEPHVVVTLAISHKDLEALRIPEEAIIGMGELTWMTC